MDRNADPCHDFFQYACGSWNRKHVIPEDRSSISTFEVMADQLQVILKGILEQRPTKEDNFATTKAKYFYQSCMNMCKSAVCLHFSSQLIYGRPLIHILQLWTLVFSSSNCWSQWYSATESNPVLRRLAGKKSVCSDQLIFNFLFTYT